MWTRRDHHGHVDRAAVYPLLIQQGPQVQQLPLALLQQVLPPQQRGRIHAFPPPQGPLGKGQPAL